MKKRYLGLVKIGGKAYKCEVVNGVRYIDGKTVDEFMATLPPKDLTTMAIKGYKVLKRKHSCWKGQLKQVKCICGATKANQTLDDIINQFTKKERDEQT